MSTPGQGPDTETGLTPIGQNVGTRKALLRRTRFLRQLRTKALALGSFSLSSRTSRQETPTQKHENELQAGPLHQNQTDRRHPESRCQEQDLPTIRTRIHRDKDTSHPQGQESQHPHHLPLVSIPASMRHRWCIYRPTISDESSQKPKGKDEPQNYDSTHHRNSVAI